MCICMKRREQKVNRSEWMPSRVAFTNCARWRITSRERLVKLKKCRRRAVKINIAPLIEKFLRSFAKAQDFTNSLKWNKCKTLEQRLSWHLKCFKSEAEQTKRKATSAWATPTRPRWDVKKEGSVKVCPARQTSEGKAHR